tara:strand:+ start:2176 stop:3651 length:1476 start_codon:yes stop_codon:yes gene_type:complete
MRGGKFLGSGTYGCIFYPAVACNNNNQIKPGVGKVFSSKNESDIEHTLGKQFYNMDKKGEYFNILTNSCDVSKNTLLANNSSKECKHIVDTKDVYQQLIYKEKGSDLSKFFRNKVFELSDKVIVEYIKNMLLCVDVLQKHKMAHLDIKPENILISDSEKLLLIDFGLARKISDIYNILESYFILEYSYHIYPPEFKIFMVLDTLRTNELLGIKLKKSKYEYYRVLQNSILDTYNRTFAGIRNYQHIQSELKDIDMSKYFIKYQIQEFIETLVNKMMEANLNHTSNMRPFFAEHFGHKADVFSVGVTMLYFYQFSVKNNTACVDGYLNLIKNMLNMNAFQRYTIQQTIEEYDALYNKKKPSPLKPSIVNQPSPDKKQVKECMKMKKKDLIELVISNNLPKSVKYENKENICKKLMPYLTPTVYYTPTPNTNTFTKEYCSKYYTLQELKELVNTNNLPKKLKSQKKTVLCEALLPHLTLKENPKTIKRGPKKQ